MKPLTTPIKLHEISFNVVRLHHALEVLGYSIDEDEKKMQVAGETTLSQARLLQQKFTITFDGNLLADAATVFTINRELQQRGWLGDTNGHSFKVSGRVINQDGKPQAEQRLLSVDVDLKGAAVFRTVKTVSELKKQPGFQIL